MHLACLAFSLFSALKISAAHVPLSFPVNAPLYHPYVCALQVSKKGIDESLVQKDA